VPLLSEAQKIAEIENVGGLAAAFLLQLCIPILRPFQRARPESVTIIEYMAITKPMRILNG